MQLPINPSASQFAALLDAVNDDRLDRFLPAADGSREDAFRLYLWNCALCEAFYLPLHFAEITIRNAIHDHLLRRIGSDWYDNLALIGSLEDQRRRDFSEVLRKERNRHGAAFTCHHLVSELSFGFWAHIVTKRFGRIVWAPGIRAAFPNLPASMDRPDVFEGMDGIKSWRNRVAHHKPIFDHGPAAKYQDILKVISWVSNDVADWVVAASRVTEAIQLRPVPNLR